MAGNTSEKKKTKQSETLKKVFRHLGRYRIFVVFSILLATVSVALTLYIPKLTGYAVDYVVGPGEVSFSGAIRVMIRIGICTLITALAQWLMNVCNNKMTYQIVRDIRNEAFRKIEILPLKYIDGHPYGEVVSRVIADVDQFADGLLMGFTQLFTGVATIVGTLCFMLSVNVMITFVVVLITPVSFLVANFIAKRTFSMFRIQSEIRGEQTGLIDEMIGNQKVVQAFGKGRISLFLGVTRWLGFNIPMLFILNTVFGMYGIVWSQVTADILTVILSFYVFYRFGPDRQRAG